MRTFNAVFPLLVLGLAAAPAAASELDLLKQVRQAIEANQKAANYGEWIAQPATPDSLFARVRALPSGYERDAAWVSLCDALNRIGTVELAMFSDEIQESRLERAFRCAPALIHRVEEFYRSQAVHYQDGMTPSVGEPRLRVELNEAGSGGAQPRVAVAPSAQLKNETRELNASLTPVLSPGFLFRSKTPPGQGAFLPHSGLAPKEICLTFDDGPIPDRTGRVLDALTAAGGLKVNFFQVGRNASNHPEISREVAERGHVVGSHSMSHPILSSIPLAKARTEILGGHAAVEKATGQTTPFFRFPGGGWNNALFDITDQAGLATFFWDMDTRDWQIHDPARLLAMARRELKRAEYGNLLFHDTQPATWVILPQFLQDLADQGYTVVQYAPKSNTPRP